LEFLEHMQKLSDRVALKATVLVKSRVDLGE
jgi:hypothetical protein